MHSLTETEELTLLLGTRKDKEELLKSAKCQHLLTELFKELISSSTQLSKLPLTPPLTPYDADSSRLKQGKFRRQDRQDLDRILNVLHNPYCAPEILERLGVWYFHYYLNPYETGFSLFTHLNFNRSLTDHFFPLAHRLYLAHEVHERSNITPSLELALGLIGRNPHLSESNFKHLESMFLENFQFKFLLLPVISRTQNVYLLEAFFNYMKKIPSYFNITQALEALLRNPLASSEMLDYIILEQDTASSLSSYRLLPLSHPNLSSSAAKKLEQALGQQKAYPLDKEIP